MFGQVNNFLLSLLGLICFLTCICQLQDNMVQLILCTYYFHLPYTVKSLGVGAKRRLSYKFEKKNFSHFLPLCSLSTFMPSFLIS